MLLDVGGVGYFIFDDVVVFMLGGRPRWVPRLEPHSNDDEADVDDKDDGMFCGICCVIVTDLDGFER